jgi:hypothetical protein
MGVDMEVYVEHRTADGWALLKLGALDYEKHECRSYSLYGWLAGVRVDDYPPLVEPRGLPEDIAEETRREVGRLPIATSWLSVAEVLDGRRTLELAAATPSDQPPKDIPFGWFFEWVDNVVSAYDGLELRLVLGFYG